MRILKLIPAIIAVSLPVVPLYVEADPDSKYILVAAHRGGYKNEKKDDAPENSVVNLEVAVRKGFDLYETDIRCTKDGVFVVVHDDTLNRETNGKGPVEDLKFSEVQQLNKRFRDGSLSGYGVATLEQLLLAGKGRISFKADLKPGVIERFSELAGLIDRIGMTEDVFLRTGIKDAPKIAECFRKGAPKVEVMFRAGTVEQVKKIVEEFSPKTIQINGEKNEELSERKRQ
ncbi:MAG: glycerophosphodiester phosphodiesterase family protein, partial [Verrucomicrobiales bacterium]|nr:glycerophosphodiester phosphodiesterase family protein [Verrucomicrobiales bacterium]